STDLPVRNPLQPALAGGADAFVAKFADSLSGSVDSDILISLRTGHIQVYNAAGGLTRDIVGGDDGPAKGMVFDSVGNLFVAHWAGSSGAAGNNIEVFNSNLSFQGTFVSGLNCNPTSLVRDSGGNLFAGLADCSGDVLKFSPLGALLASFDVAAENHGAEWIDLAADNCTLFYGSEGPHVKRFNVCAGVQLPDFNSTPLGGVFQVKVLPDTTVLAATPNRIVRLDTAGSMVQQYVVPGETCFRGVGLDPTGTAFFATNYCNSHVYKFDLATGAVLTAFTASSPEFTVKTVIAKAGTPLETHSTCSFTGGGSFPAMTGPSLTMLTNVADGFEIHCNTSDLPNNIELTWDSSNQFHLETLVSVSCTGAPCNTISGTGIGRYNGVSGATIQFTLMDSGEPGTNDPPPVRITRVNGHVVLDANTTTTTSP